MQNSKSWLFLVGYLRTYPCSQIWVIFEPNFVVVVVACMYANNAVCMHITCVRFPLSMTNTLSPPPPPPPFPSFPCVISESARDLVESFWQCSYKGIYTLRNHPTLSIFYVFLTLFLIIISKTGWVRVFRLSVTCVCTHNTCMKYIRCNDGFVGPVSNCLFLCLRCWPRYVAHPMSCLSWLVCCLLLTQLCSSQSSKTSASWKFCLHCPLPNRRREKRGGGGGGGGVGGGGGGGDRHREGIIVESMIESSEDVFNTLVLRANTASVNLEGTCKI